MAMWVFHIQNMLIVGRIWAPNDRIWFLILSLGTIEYLKCRYRMVHQIVIFNAVILII